MDQLSLCTDCFSDQQDQSSRQLAQMLNVQDCHIDSPLKVVPAVHEIIKTLHCLIEQGQHSIWVQLCSADGSQSSINVPAHSMLHYSHRMMLLGIRNAMHCGWQHHACMGTVAP